MPVTQHDHVDGNETLLRGVLDRDLKPELDRPVPPDGFSPGSQDTDGISLFRERFTNFRSVSDCLGQKWSIVRVRAQDCIDAGATLTPAPKDSCPPGHVIIPEIRIGLNGAEKMKMKQLRTVLAGLVRAEDIVYRP